LIESPPLFRTVQSSRFDIGGDGIVDEESIFEAALECATPEARQALVKQACAGDAKLEGLVSGLLLAHDNPDTFLQSLGSRVVATLNPLLPERPGTMIGPYKLQEQIGEGGMGLVFMAEQTQPVKRRVALKVLKPGMDSRQVVARFEAERQALALMDHPHIAKIHDAGATASGRPYFVMELVRGVPITEFCDQHRLTPRQRLELFVTVCQAVQHAHQKGIIHRDLKPTNVLVTLHDTVAVPKVIDFGIAKATTQPLTERTLFTHFAQMVGTPLYMSPEQAEMNGLDVDTRSDVYSLGVLLYELLTGATPFESDRLKKAGLDEIRRLIREQEPPAPSQRLDTLDAQACSTISERHGVDRRRLGQVLRGELDWIVMKALEKDRDRRYESASAFAQDVLRYLNDEPVAACPPSAGYRLRKYVRRNRQLLVMAGAIAIVLASATAVSVWLAVKAHSAELRAASEADIARAVNDFLQKDLLEQVGSVPLINEESERNHSLTVKEALDRAAERIGTRFQNQPLVEAAIQTTIGVAYHNLFEFEPAVVHLERARDLLSLHLGAEHPDTLGSMGRLAWTYQWLGRHQEDIAIRRQLVDYYQSHLGPEHRTTRAATLSLALAYEAAGDLETSGHLLEQLLERARSVEGLTHPDTLGITVYLARNRRFSGQLSESIALYQHYREATKSEFGTDISAMHLRGFAEACVRAGKYDQADHLLRDALQWEQNQKDSLSHRDGIANNLGRMAISLVFQERYKLAEPLARQALGSPYSGGLHYHYWEGALGAALLGQGKYVEAEDYLKRSYKGLKQLVAYVPMRQTRLTDVGEWILRLYDATNQPEKARDWREKISQEARQK
jgi:non-specific serine/threonine protein kinase/serine/threonine-protein kinase